MINKKLKTYDSYRPVELNFTNQIPSDWAVLRAKFVLKEVNERSINGSEQLLSVSEHKGVVPRDSITVNMFQAENYTGYKLCKPGDVVINSLWAWHRGIGVAKHTGIVSTAYSVHRLIKPENWNPEYLSYLLRTKAYVGEYLIRSKGIWDSRLQLTGNNFLNVPVLVPPLSTQNAIVAYLDRKTKQIQEFIQKKERLIESIRERELRSIEFLITKGVERQDSFKKSRERLFGEIPINWQEKRLRFVASKVKTGSTPSGKVKDYFENEDFNWFTPGDFSETLELNNSERKISFEAIKDKQVPVFPKKSVLIIGIGGTTGKVGLTANIASSNQQINSITFTKEVIPEYGLHLLGFIGRNLLKILDYTTLPILNQAETKNLPFLVPPIDEQELIISEVRQIITNSNQTIGKIKKEIEKIFEYQESLITQVVTGQLKVPELKKEALTL
jgi:type I restriction enzyme S subunit